MTYSIGNTTFGTIKNVRKSGDEDGVYFVDIDMSFSEGFPAEPCLYCARSDDYASTGKWVYQQIIDGNFEGVVTQLGANCDPVTGLLVENYVQPTVVGAQKL
jgi:hypothetical protein